MLSRTRADAGTLIFIAQEILLSMSLTCEEYSNSQWIQLSLNLYVGSIGLQLELVRAVVVPEVADHDPARAARHLHVSRVLVTTPRVTCPASPEPWQLAPGGRSTRSSQSPDF